MFTIAVLALMGTPLPAHHLQHDAIFGPGQLPINRAVLRAVDRVQAHAMDGGGYFIGVHAQPAETPVGYPLSLGGKPLIKPPRTTSYCSGSSYTAFIEALNELLGPRLEKLDAERLEALRMQEPDGGRREDGVKAWGWWNADGWGDEFALIQYLGMGRRIRPADALPGDFMNISWKSGLGHSTVFLRWTRDGVRYWSSQKGTNGYGDQESAKSKIESVVVVRLTNLDGLYTFNPKARVNTKVVGDPVP